MHPIVITLDVPKQLHFNNQIKKKYSQFPRRSSSIYRTPSWKRAGVQALLSFFWGLAKRLIDRAVCIVLYGQVQPTRVVLTKL